MKRTKQAVAAVLIAGLLATLVVVPQVAEAGGRHWGRGGHGHGYHGGYGGPGYFWGGLAAGAFTGIVVGSLLAPRVYAAPPVVYQPAPVIVQSAPVIVQAAPVCSNFWVPTSWNGVQWVPGYWAQACR
jgi:hypothetical protein